MLEQYLNAQPAEYALPQQGAAQGGVPQGGVPQGGAPQGGMPQHAAGVDPYTQQMQGALAQYKKLLDQPKASKGLSKADKNRALMDFGLNLMQAGGDWRNGLGSALGAAGSATLGQMDARQAAHAQAQAQDQAGQQSYIEQQLKLLAGGRAYAADRSDAKAKRQQAAAKLKSQDDYRGTLADLKRRGLAQDGAYNAARIDAQKALAEQRRSGMGGQGEGQGWWPYPIPPDEARQQYTTYLKGNSTRGPYGISSPNEGALQYDQWLERTYGRKGGTPGDPLGILSR